MVIQYFSKMSIGATLVSFLFCNSANADDAIKFARKNRKTEIMSTTTIQNKLNNKSTKINGAFAVAGAEQNVIVSSEDEETVDIPVDKIIATIRKYREKLCAAGGESTDFKLFLKAGTKTEVLIVAASAEAGIEVLLRCGKPGTQI